MEDVKKIITSELELQRKLFDKQARLVMDNLAGNIVRAANRFDEVMNEIASMRKEVDELKLLYGQVFSKATVIQR